MTRKHYEAFASMLSGMGDRYQHDEHALEVLRQVRDAMCDEFAEDNPRFSRNKFLAAVAL